jgi:putative photosynthetic complex assembly protein 2
VLLLVGLSHRFDIWRMVAAAGLLVASLYGLATSSGDASVGGAYLAFTSTVLLWGAQEIVFLAGWVTGPRAMECPRGVRGWERFSLALKAILYHEFLLLACGAAIVALTWAGPNQVGLWTFATLWILRQSSKINLFLGVPVTNEELMPDAVRFLKSFFARKSVSAFFPLSVTLATAVLVVMIQRLAEVAVLPFDIAGLSLVSTLFALGILEHWFMLLPLPAITLWGWGVKPHELESNAAPAGVSVTASNLDSAIPSLRDSPSASPDAATFQAHMVVLSAVRSDPIQPKVKQMCARQRLEDQFRQTFLEQHARADLGTARRSIGVEPTATVNGRTS